MIKSFKQTIEISLRENENERVEEAFNDLLDLCRYKMQVNYVYMAQQFADDNFTDLIQASSESESFKTPKAG